MDQLKAELMQICRERGDTGDHSVHQRMVHRFFDELLKVFTLKGVESFSAVELRDPYVSWVNSQVDGKEAQMISFFHTRQYPRSLPVTPEPLGNNVVSFFTR